MSPAEVSVPSPELARPLGVSVAESRALLRAVLQAYPIGWLHPETDYIASFPPLNGLPTQYRITVRGEPKWFAQCGFEATSATWLFPGATVRIDAACLDCGDPMAGFFGTETRQHMLDPDYLSRWYLQRGAERRAYLTRIGKASPFWLGTPGPDASPPETR